MKYSSLFIAVDAECNAVGCHAYESFSDWLEKYVGIDIFESGILFQLVYNLSVLLDPLRQIQHRCSLGQMGIASSPVSDFEIF